MRYLRSLALFLLLITATYGVYSFLARQNATGGRAIPALTTADQAVLINWVNGIPQEVGACVQLAALSAMPGTTPSPTVDVDCGQIIRQEMAADAPPPQVSGVPAVQHLTQALQSVADAYRARNSGGLATAARDAGTASLHLLRLLGLAGSVVSPGVGGIQ